MTFDPALLTFAEPAHLWLEVSQTEIDRAWQRSQSFSSNRDRWNAYLNQICLNTVLDWIVKGFFGITNIN